MKQRKTRYVDGRGGLALPTPMTEHQADYLDALDHASTIVSTGPAGTGKTYLAASWAAVKYLSKEIDRIILVRPNVPAGRSLGFFPGSLEEKMDPWVAPVMETLREYLGQGVLDTGVKNGNIRVIPFETMRGLSADYSFILLDEAQNTTPKQMEMFLTRIGKGTTVCVNGDVSQHDMSDRSGLSHLLEIIETQRLAVPVIRFVLDDVVRSDQCKMWIEAYEKAREEDHRPRPS